jgi:hypothetical protein
MRKCPPTIPRRIDAGTPRRRRVLCAVVAGFVAAACDDGTGGGAAPVDAAPYVNTRDRNVIEREDVPRPPPSPTDDAEPPPADTDALRFIDGTLPPPSDAGATPDGQSPDADEPRPDAERPPRPDAEAPPPRPDAAVPPPPDDDCEAALQAATFTFEAGPDGFTHEISDGVDAPGWPLDPWEHGRASSGPGACAEGQRCWATDLDDNLTQCQRAALVSPPIDLGACAGRRIVLVFEHWYAFWLGADLFEEYFDGGTVELSTDDRTWEIAAPGDYPGVIHPQPSLGFGYECIDPFSFHVDGAPGFVGESGGWETARMALGADAAGRFRLRFAFATGVSAETTDPFESQALSPPGWYIDHVRFEAR